MKLLKVIGNILAGKQYIIHAEDYTEQEAMELEAKLNKQKFTVVRKEILVEQL